MTISIIHISDLHLQENWHEEQGFVLREFAADLKDQINEGEDYYAIFTGDILQEGKDPEGYEFFSSTLGKKLNSLGLSRDRLIFVPGNHDVDRSYTEENFSTLKSIQERRTSERDFNNNVYGNQNELLKKKFLPFLDWQKIVSSWPLAEDSYCGRGFDLTEDVGIYCLNTALYSFGGLKDEDGNSVSDFQELPVETRKLQDWLDTSTHKYRILAMHHPQNWLMDWAKKEIETLCFRYFDLVLSGHEHEKDSYHIYNGSESTIHCVAPPLFTKKSDVLGYSILEIAEQTKELNIHYRQWAGDRFVAGTLLSKTNTGSIKLVAAQIEKIDQTHGKDSPTRNAISASLKNNFMRSLKCYASLPTIWVVPNLSDQAEFSASNTSAVIFSADYLFAPFNDCVIKAPPQFGLSSLGLYLAHAAWEADSSQYAMVIKSQEMENHESAIEEYIESRLEELGLKIDDLAAIILDEPAQVNARKINNIKKLFSDIPLVILLSVNDHEIVGKVDDDLQGDFATYYLWSLERSQIRDIVKQFINFGKDLKEDAALQRLVDDIENLNLHRTPLNCLTLLTVYERQIDYSPNNRTDMFERFLFLIFFTYKKNPDYSSFPDMKDALAVLGGFCEAIIREENNQFTKNNFILSSTKFCEKISIDVDCSQLFEVMNRENIIIGIGEAYSFRYVHWIYFFGAHRMHHDAEFCQFILNETNYMNFPEIIEFYSGIDRRREGLLKTLTSDLKAVNEAFEKRTGILSDFDPYSEAHWRLDEKEIGELKSRLKEEAAQSSLPMTLKDEIADETYNRALPYNQEIRSFVKDSNLLECIQIVSAAARALRNSDYVDSDTKKKLLKEIMRAWSKELQVLFILSPVLAKQRSATFQNMMFYLDSSYDKFEGEDLWHRIVGSLPTFVTAMHEKDIASMRIAPLLEDFIVSDENGPSEFILANVVIKNRPNKWHKIINAYIKRLPKNSFYLLKVYHSLSREYRYGFVLPEAKLEIFELMATTIAKHEVGVKYPNKKLIEKAKISLGKVMEERKK